MLRSTSLSRWWLGIVFAGLFLGCGGGGDSGFGFGGGGGMGGGGFGFSLVVDSATYRTVIESISPASGRVFVDAGVTIKNDTATKPVSANVGFFTLTTAGGIAVTGAGNTAFAQSPCSPFLAVITGGSLSCHLIFEVPVGDAPQKLSYKDDSGRTASASIDMVSIALFNLAPGIYTRKQFLPAMNGCSLDISNSPYTMLTLVGDATSHFTFAELVDANKNPVVIPRTGNTGTLTTHYPAANRMGCTFDDDETRTFTVTADGEFDYISDNMLSNRMGCKTAGDCETILGAHYSSH